ncbi:hypothetical protein IW152_000679 [Coemansia sp. BCRC 34962]|nr:hypothetical protein IW152_000679 [Coemansia sp. BCRC 34962]
MTTTVVAEASQSSEQRLQALSEKLKQVAGLELGVDREQVLAKAAELRALASELEDYVGSLGSSDAKALASTSSHTFPRCSRKPMNVVKMPRLGTVFGLVSGEDAEFTAQVAVPPGGLTFIASAAVMQESDDDSVSASVDIAEIADAMRGAAMEPASEVERVGGFVHPAAGSIAKALLAQAKQQQQQQTIKTEESSSPSSSSGMAPPQMPVPADHTPASGELVPPSGFDVYGMTSWATATTTSVSAPVAEGVLPSATAAMPALPGMYGAMPLPYPLPHHPLPMHCGFIPPLMYGVPPSMGSPAPPPPPGLGPTASVSTAAASSDALVEQPQSELWVPEHGIVDANGVPRSKLVLAMPGTDHYQHAVAAAAAAAAAGYPMNVPFMYPHIDSSNISAAATGGGSENNESVVSVDSTSNRGIASRYAPMHYLPQVPSAGGESSARGFVSGSEYPPPSANQYVWSEHSKHMTAGHGAYPYQQQGYQQGYRRRGSGSNNSSGSGSANGSNANINNSGGSGGSYHHHQSRDHRRGNTGGGGGYQRQQQQQQRWNNNSNNNGNNSSGYNSRHSHNHHHHQHRHNQSPHNSTFSQDTGPPPPPPPAAAFSGVAPSEVSIGSSNSGYYTSTQ